MTTTAFLPVPIFRAFDSAGNPLAGGLLYSYAAGTTTPLATYSDAAGAVPNANPVVLDSTGSATVRLGTSAYKFVLKDSSGTTQWTEDNYLPGVGDSPTFAGTVTGGALHITGDSQIDGNEAVTGNLTVTGALAAGGYSVPPIIRSFKNTTTSRANTTTVTSDPALQVALSAAMTCSFKVWINDTAGSTSAGGLKGRMNYSGTYTTNGWGMQGSGTGVTSVPLVSVGVVGQQFEASQNGQGNMLITGYLTATGAGVLSFDWAQQSSNATASLVGVGSWIEVMVLQ